MIEDHAILVVMGDIGRSPRMCYHAVSLAEHGVNVELVGYLDSQPHEKVSSHEKIKLVNVPKPNKFFRFFGLLGRCVWMSLALLFVALFKTRSQTSLLMVQNPPGIPTLIICLFVRWLKRANFVIDWHNYTWSVMQYRSSPMNDYSRQKSLRPLSWFKFVAHLEGMLGSQATWNFCVSDKMKADLYDRWGIVATTLYDKAPNWIFRPLSLEERHAFLFRFFNQDNGSEIVSSIQSSDMLSEETLFTYKSNKDDTIHLKTDRPLLLISSTSWTKDEDFSLLLDALCRYDAHCNNNIADLPVFPKIFVIITGKGDLKGYYNEQIKRLHLHNIFIATPWLAAEDYPKLLACADMGVSLHVSTSGLDLPMKVVDMLGCKIPVLTKCFSTVNELILHGINGYLFDTSQELCQLLLKLGHNFPNSKELNELKNSTKLEHLADWNSNWNNTAWPILDKIFTSL